MYINISIIINKRLIIHLIIFIHLFKISLFSRWFIAPTDPSGTGRQVQTTAALQLLRGLLLDPLGEDLPTLPVGPGQEWPGHRKTSQKCLNKWGLNGIEIWDETTKFYINSKCPIKVYKIVLTLSHLRLLLYGTLGSSAIGAIIWDGMNDPAEPSDEPSKSINIIELNDKWDPIRMWFT